MTLPSEIIFHNRQRIGDMLMFTCGIRDFKKQFPQTKVGVISTAMHIWDNNPHVDLSLKPFYKNGKTLETVTTEDLFNGNTNVLKIGPSKLTNNSNWKDWHFANAFRVSMEDHLKVNIEQGESRGDIWLTHDEYNAPRINEKPYWIIITGGEKGWGCKMYPTVRWQEVINQNPDILFYQLGSKGDNHIRLTGPNVIDYIGKTEDRATGLRDLFRLFLNSEGSIGLVSFHMHLSGALSKPCVVVAGAREPVSFTRYAGHQYISNDGCLPCGIQACWKCEISACKWLVDNNGNTITLPDNATQEQKDAVMPKCVDMISSEEVTRNLRRYYEGGRLVIGKASPKIKFKNLVKATPKPVAIPKQEIKKEVTTIEGEDDAAETSPLINSYGLKFNGGALTIRDFRFIEQTIKKYGVKTVLEFGSGLSTLLFADMKLNKFISYECHEGWINKLNGLRENLDIREWDGYVFNNIVDMEFDMAFVDGPSGDSNRERSTQIASERAKIVVVHDAGREHAKIFQEKYLVPGFDGPFKGGHRCHLWVKKGVLTSDKERQVGNLDSTPGKAAAEKAATFPPLRLNATKQKHIKLVFNGRGEGGAETTVTWIMNKLIEMGHKVDYLTPGSVPCGTFKKIGSKEVNFIPGNENIISKSVNEPCDVFFFYSNDWIWEFNKKELVDAFSDIKAPRKIMGVNYKLDKIGTVPWTKQFGRYLFLSSSHEKVLKERIPHASTKVMAPPVDLSKYFEIELNYKDGLRLIRHSSQGDSKYPTDYNQIVDKVISARPDASLRLMPAPTFLQAHERVYFHKKNDPIISEYLKLGNCFIYNLPKGYTEGGPKVIMEAQAAGMCVIADNHSGMIDRIVPGTGFLCNNIDEFIAAIKMLTPLHLEAFGRAAREHAKKEYNPMNWINEILGE